MEDALETIITQLEQLEALHGTKPTASAFKKPTNKDLDEDEDAEMVDLRKLKKILKQQALYSKLEVIHKDVWPVDKSYSLRSTTDSLETEGTSTFFCMYLEICRNWILVAAYDTERGYERKTFVYPRTSKRNWNIPQRITEAIP